MKYKTLLLVATVGLSLTAISCSKSPDPKSNANASTSQKNATSPKPKGMKIAKPGESAPEAKKSLPEGKKVPVPQDWERMYDDDKGYEFAVPAGTKSDWQTVEGVDVFVATIPEPAKVAAIVIAFKNKSLSKADLLETAKRFLAGMGEKDIRVGTVEPLSDDYDLVEVTSVDEKGVTTKAKLLMATDVSDNYIVLVGSPEPEFKANEKVIDEIWGSFGMYSGGASGQS